MRLRLSFAALTVLVAALLLALTSPVAPAGAAPAARGVAGGGAMVAQDEAPELDPDGDPATDDAPVPVNDIIPEPDSGRPPTDAGDRGGALQIALFLAIVAGLGLIVTLVVRESRRARPRLTGDPAPVDTRPT